MGSVITSQRDRVEQWSPTLFLLGGGLMVGHAALSGIHAFTNLPTPPDVFVTSGHLVALVGLLGVYPVLVTRPPAVAWTAISVALVALGSWAVMTITQLLAFAGVVSSLEGVLPGSFFVVVLASTILTYVLFGIATLRGNGSRTIGLLVLTPGGLTVALVVIEAISGVTAIHGLGIASGLALSMLALGFTLRRWDRPTKHAAPKADGITG